MAGMYGAKGWVRLCICQLAMIGPMNLMFQELQKVLYENVGIAKNNKPS